MPSVSESIERIECRARQLLASSNIDRDEAYRLVEWLFTELSSSIGSKFSKEASKRGTWSVELLDNAVDEIVDRCGGSYSVLELWEMAWEVRLGNGDPRELLRKLIEVIELIKRKNIAKGRGRGRRAHRR